MKLLAPLLLALSSCASTGLVLETVPPTEDPLVEVAAMDSRIRVLAVYATPDNFVGETLYPEPRIFLRRSAMERLSAHLAAQGPRCRLQRNVGSLRQLAPPAVQSAPRPPLCKHP